ncbi:MAG TPA: hypothetical protein VFU22_14120 [Roseiflexaceae bacterium]|nr:hypothetical protein [Roseiflexaceae bacterium]
MSGRWWRGCVVLLALPLGTLLLLMILAGAGIVIGIRQPGEVWAVPIRRGYFAIGRIVNSADCRRLHARGLVCSRRYGALLYLPRGGRGVEYTLFSFPEPGG